MTLSFIRALDVSGTGIGSSSPLTISNFVVNASDGEHLIIVVGVTLDTSGGSQSSSVVRGSQSFTLLDRTSLGGNKRAEMWYLVDPTPGTISIVITATVDNYMGAGAMLFSGVETSNPFNTSNKGQNTNDTPSVAVTTTAPNCIVVDVVCSDSADANGGAGQTTQWTEDFTFNASRGSTEDAASATTYTQTWGTSAGDWAMVVGALQPYFDDFEQEGYRFRNDDGNETTATWKENQDTATQEGASVNTRLRVLINATGNPPSRQFKLQWRRKGLQNTWYDVIVE